MLSILKVPQKGTDAIYSQGYKLYEKKFKRGKVYFIKIGQNRY
jgi:hypothetical protein